jgi:hypothetical protein
MNAEKLQEILSSDLVWLYLGSLISSDVLISKEKCIESLEKLNFIKDNIDKLELSEELKNKIINYSIKGIDIVNQDLKEYD